MLELSGHVKWVDNCCFSMIRDSFVKRDVWHWFELRQLQLLISSDSDIFLATRGNWYLSSITPESNTLHNYKVYFAVVKIRAWNRYMKGLKVFSAKDLCSLHIILLLKRQNREFSRFIGGKTNMNGQNIPWDWYRDNFHWKTSFTHDSKYLFESIL